MIGDENESPVSEESLLMIPGPSDVSPEVLEALGGPVETHYGNEWAKYYNEVTTRAKRLLGVLGDLFIYPGSGHLGLDAVIGSLFEPGNAVITVENGFFGDRLAELARAHELRVISVAAPWGEAADPDTVERTMADHPEASGVLVVHGETSTGVLNPVRDIAFRAQRRGLRVVVDAVSSAGIAPLQVDEWGIDACVTASQKGLGTPPGLVLVAVGDGGWDVIDKRSSTIRGWSANLAVWRRYRREFAEFQPYFVTMPVNVVRALGASLQAIEAEGLDRRLARHLATSRDFRLRLNEIGIEVIAPAACALPAVTAFRLPDRLNAGDVRDALSERHGILVSTGLGPWRDRVIRIGHMGVNARPDRVERVMRALSDVLRLERNRP